MALERITMETARDAGSIARGELDAGCAASSTMRMTGRSGAVSSSSSTEAGSATAPSPTSGGAGTLMSLIACLER